HARVVYDPYPRSGIRPVLKHGLHQNLPFPPRPDRLRRSGRGGWSITVIPKPKLKHGPNTGCAGNDHKWHEDA
ncbi:MAG: hypothetical protein WCJ35_21885, partial [Planctomycetota bacterium]